MSSVLLPCAHCARHFRASEEQCPFCATARVVEVSSAVQAVRMSRAAILALGTAVAFDACTSTPASPYGAPPESRYSSGGGAATQDAGTATDPDVVTVIAIYGAPAPK